MLCDWYVSLLFHSFYGSVLCGVKRTLVSFGKEEGGAKGSKLKLLRVKSRDKILRKVDEGKLQFGALTGRLM